MSTVGANGTVLTVSGGVPTWQTPAGFSGVLDVLKGGTGLVNTGTSGQLLTSVRNTATVYSGTGSVGTVTVSGGTTTYPSGTQVLLAGFTSTPSINGTQTVTGGSGTSITFATTATTASVLGTVSSLSWGAIDLTSQVSGILPIVNGGTGSSTFPVISLTSGVSGILPLANGGTGLSSIGGAGTLLTSNGTSASWSNTFAANSGGSLGSGVFNFSNTATSNHFISAFTSPLANNNTLFMGLGKALSAYNCGLVAYNHVSDGSSSLNNINFSVYNGLGVSINGLGQLRIPDSMIYLRSGSDTNHYLGWDATLDGPKIGGWVSVGIQAQGNTRAIFGRAGIDFYGPSPAGIYLTVDAGGTKIPYETASQAVFLDSAKALRSRPGFSYQVWNATADTGMPNNSWVSIDNVIKVSGGGNGELVQFDGSKARFRNDSGTPMLWVATLTSGHSSLVSYRYAQRIQANGNIINENEQDVGTNGRVVLSATGVVNAGQAVEFQLNQYSGSGKNGTGIRISITTYPLL